MSFKKNSLNQQYELGKFDTSGIKRNSRAASAMLADEEHHEQKHRQGTSDKLAILLISLVSAADGWQYGRCGYKSAQVGPNSTASVSYSRKMRISQHSLVNAGSVSETYLSKETVKEWVWAFRGGYKMIFRSRVKLILLWQSKTSSRWSSNTGWQRRS